jgi:hypothetical protein
MVAARGMWRETIVGVSPGLRCDRQTGAGRSREIDSDAMKHDRETKTQEVFHV